jgi:hypothetical protein
VTGAPLALAWNRGERMIRLPPLPAHQALLVTPEVPVATADAFRWVDQTAQPSGRKGAVALDLAALSGWGDGLWPLRADQRCVRGVGRNPAPGVPNVRIGINPVRYLSLGAGPGRCSNDAGPEARTSSGGRDCSFAGADGGAGTRRVAAARLVSPINAVEASARSTAPPHC